MTAAPLLALALALALAPSARAQNLYPASYTASGTPTTPSAPASARLFVAAGDALRVDFAPPDSDGGALETSYRVEWDAAPHTPEVQTVTTQVYTGPNGVQRLTSFAATTYEVQAFRTAADAAYEVQGVTTLAALGETLAGSFTLLLDTTAFGGGAYTTGDVQWDAAAMAGDGGAPPRTSLQEALEAVPGVGAVRVSVSAPDEQGGRTWTVTFLELMGNVPLMALGSSSLQGVGADVALATLADGRVLGGTFTLGFRRRGQVDPTQFVEARTSPLPFDATPAEVQTALEGLATVGQVVVDRPAGPDARRGYTWTVTFVGREDAGDQPPLLAYFAATLQGRNARVAVCSNGTAAFANATLGDATSDCFGLADAVGAPIAVQDGSVLGGGFFVGGGSVLVPWNALEADLGNAIEAASPHLAPVAVSRVAGPDRNGAFMWDVTFAGTQGPLPLLAVDASALSGVGAGVNVTAMHVGTYRAVQLVRLPWVTTVTGTISLSLGGATTRPLSLSNGTCYDLSAGDVQLALEALSTVGNVDVECAPISDAVTPHGAAYTITFHDAGPIANLIVDVSRLFDNFGVGGAGPGTYSQESVTSLVTGDAVRLGGSFALLFLGQRTAYMPFDVSAVDMQAQLSHLTSLGSVSVSRGDVTPDGG